MMYDIKMNDMPGEKREDEQNSGENGDTSE